MSGRVRCGPQDHPAGTDAWDGTPGAPVRTAASFVTEAGDPVLKSA
ncbi:hypothetical protein ACF05W_29235 [Streptomyces lydicus]